jgi:hypothetical protein
VPGGFGVHVSLNPHTSESAGTVMVVDMTTAISNFPPRRKFTGTVFAAIVKTVTANVRPRRLSVPAF